MLPKTKDSPASACQTLIRVPISTPVAIDLLAPPRCVCFRPSSVRRTAVPEAAIDEDGNSRAQERNVSAAARSWQSGIDAITQAKRTQLRTESELARRVTLTRHLHAMARVVG